MQHITITEKNHNVFKFHEHVRKKLVNQKYFHDHFSAIGLTNIHKQKFYGPIIKSMSFRSEKIQNGARNP